MNRNLLIVLLTISIVTLILSIISLVKCKDTFAGSVLNKEECYNSHFDEDELKRCLNQVKTLTTNINSQYWGQPGNRGLTYPGGPVSGSFGNPEIIN